jgi:hypothetical protein
MTIRWVKGEPWYKVVQKIAYDYEVGGGGALLEYSVQKKHPVRTD